MNNKDNMSPPEFMNPGNNNSDETEDKDLKMANKNIFRNIEEDRDKSLSEDDENTSI